MDGNNIFTILVTARDGFTTSQYVIEVVRDNKIQISGSILTENKFGKHTADIIVYDKITKQEITKASANEDGTFEMEISLGEFDIVIKKEGYLKYTLTNVKLTDGIEEKVDLGEFKIYAGDINGSGEVELDDLVAINDKINYESETNTIYDLNGDGKVDILDRNMLKANYGKKEEKVSYK